VVLNFGEKICENPEQVQNTMHIEAIWQRGGIDASGN
jgi:hypothetical protein